MHVVGWFVEPCDTCQLRYWDCQPGMSYLSAPAPEGFRVGAERGGRRP
jgi:hypothetical protein